jgi:2-iminobutanoate/2-iminopropanoate deaminase
MTEKTVVSTSEAPAPIAPFSQGVIHNGLVYCSGSVGLDPKTNQIIQGGVKERTVSIKGFKSPHKSFNWICA